jgi:endonuclease/exonuclease/phosphatase family metal-dependent hydrolase
VVGVLAVALVGALWWSSRATAATADGRALAGEPSWAGVIGLVALGPWLALQLLVLQNVGFAASITGWSVPGVGVAMALANALGIGAATLATWHPRAGRALAVLVGIVLVVGLSQLVRDTPTVITVARLAVLIALSFAIVGRLVDAPASDGTRPGMWRTSVAVGAGMLLFVVLVFVYYASYDLTLGVRSDAVVTIAAVLVAVLLAVTSGAGPSRPGTTAPRRRDALVAFGLAAVLAVVPMLQSLPSPEPTSATPPPRVVTVMGWNLHNAVNAAGRLDPEAIARVIEDSGADVVGLQEVSRGWLIWGGMDMLTWLADRLDMDHTWGPTADAQWGNAILSRHPLRDVVRASLPPDTLLLRRGHVSARIETAGGLLRVHSTHFTHVDDQHVERVRQAEVIRDAWAGAPRTVIVGDLNATPESEAIAVVRSAGLVDVAAAASTPPGPTFPSTAPEVRIDYAFVSPDLVATAVPLAPTTASDHLPVAIRVEFP